MIARRTKRDARLRFTGTATEPRRPLLRSRLEVGKGILEPAVGRSGISPTDPRWVVATRTAAALQGEILPLQRREKLMGLGKSLGLTPFATTLIIAIVQDQARRGYSPENCPAAGEPQLQMIDLPQPRARVTRRLTVAAGIAALLVVELLAITLWLR